jgi:hypothetical protein
MTSAPASLPIIKTSVENFIIFGPEEAPLTHKIKQLAEKIFWIIASIFNPITNFFTQGLSDFLCLQTLRHGTCLSNYIEIRMNGTTPGFGGGVKGSSQGTEQYVENSKGHFHVFLDSDATAANMLDTGYPKKNINMGRAKTILYIFLGQLYIRMAPTLHGILSGMNAAAPVNSIDRAARTKRIFAGIFNLFTPNIKFRFREEEMEKIFQGDPDYKSIAIRTTQKIDTDHIGIKGIFYQGCQGSLRERIKSHPGKFIWGLMRLINPIGVLLLISFGIYYAVRCSQMKPSLKQD